MMVPLVMIYALFFGQVIQQKAVLTGQAVALYANMILLSSVKGDRMDPDHLRLVLTANFISMAMSALGGVAMALGGK